MFHFASMDNATEAQQVGGPHKPPAEEQIKKRGPVQDCRKEKAEAYSPYGLPIGLKHVIDACDLTISKHSVTGRVKKQREDDTRETEGIDRQNTVR